jgi:hypothetical protein
MKTGWFGSAKPGRNGSLTHIVNDDHLPICGARFAKDMQFQVCRNGADETITECSTCKGILRRALAASSSRSGEPATGF